MDFLHEEDFTDALEIDTWKRLLKHLRPFRKLLIIAGLLASTIAVFEISLPLLNRYAIDNLLLSGVLETSLTPLYWFAAFYAVVVIAFVIVIRTFILYAGKIETGVAASLREQAFVRLQELSFSYYDKTPTGWIMARMTSDSRKLSHLLAWGLIDVAWSLMLVLAIMIVMMIINLQLALITLSVMPLLLFVAFVLRKPILYAWRTVRKTNSKITASISEGIMGAVTTKTLVLEDRMEDDFNGLTSTMRRSSIRAVFISTLLWPVVLILGYFGTSLATYYGGMQVFEQTLSIGTLFLFIQYTFNFFEPILNLSRILSEIQQAQASGERIVSLIESQPELFDSPDVIAKYGTLLQPLEANWEPLNGEVVFENVSFEYKAGEPVLKNFSLTIPKGTSVAIVGETGSGKSTIVNLISRFYEPTRGRILIDGKPMKSRSIGWMHSNLGYVLQDPHLFSGSIEENIRYGKLDATIEEIHTAANVVNADSFIQNSNEGYQLNVGEDGARLSVGEKQLLSFARAIIHDPNILILDEATSSIDTETEQLIQDAIEKVLKGRTSILIAHRLSTIVKADKIIVLKKGVITEQGTHKELLAQKGYYYNLYVNQFKDEKMKEVL
jgi:ABC-type multidrug transport system, ATPase and permease components